MSELSVVIVGAGRAGGDFHIDAFNAQPDTRVVAICDPDDARAKSVAQEKGVPHTYASLGDALERHKADIVSICSPPQFHLEQAKQAMDAGAHVLLEKPMVTTIQEADKLRRYQLQACVKLCLVHNYKFQDGVQQALAMVNRGEIGKVLHVERTWLRNGTLDRMITAPDCWCHQLPGGRWTETVSHDIYITYQFLGELELVDVQARKLYDRWAWLPADEVSITLQSRLGYSIIRYSANVEDGLLRYMVIHGSKAVLITDGCPVARLPLVSATIGPVGTSSAMRQFLSGNKALAQAVLRRMRRLVSRSQQPVSASAAASVPKNPLSLPRGTGHLTVIEQFVRHVREDTDPPVSWDEAYLTMKLVDQIGRGIQAAVEQ